MMVDGFWGHLSIWKPGGSWRLTGSILSFDFTDRVRSPFDPISTGSFDCVVFCLSLLRLRKE